MTACKHGLAVDQCAFCTSSSSLRKEKNMEDAVTSKVCTKCKQDKPLEDFSISKVGRYGRDSRCKDCKQQQAREYWRKKGKTLRSVKKPQKSKEKIASGAIVVKKLLEKTTAVSNPEDPDRAKIKADEHWDYIVSLLAAHLDNPGNLVCIEFHYKTAFIHGYKHGQTDLAACEI